MPKNHPKLTHTLDQPIRYLEDKISSVVKLCGMWNNRELSTKALVTGSELASYSDSLTFAFHQTKSRKKFLNEIMIIK